MVRRFFIFFIIFVLLFAEIAVACHSRDYSKKINSKRKAQFTKRVENLRKVIQERKIVPKIKRHRIKKLKREKIEFCKYEIKKKDRAKLRKFLKENIRFHPKVKQLIKKIRKQKRMKTIRLPCNLVEKLNGGKKPEHTVESPEPTPGPTTEPPEPTVEPPEPTPEPTTEPLEPTPEPTVEPPEPTPEPTTEPPEPTPEPTSEPPPSSEEEPTEEEIKMEEAQDAFDSIASSGSELLDYGNQNIIHIQYKDNGNFYQFKDLHNCNGNYVRDLALKTDAGHYICDEGELWFTFNHLEGRPNGSFFLDVSDGPYWGQVWDLRHFDDSQGDLYISLG